MALELSFSTATPLFGSQYKNTTPTASNSFLVDLELSTLFAVNSRKQIVDTGVWSKSVISIVLDNRKSQKNW